ncbi:MAG: hypothetical protein QOK49_3566 [Baekduia sp.]|jgi:AcrR family transcriptional regulator|nr:hypothetical protein [Baekduia sp.]
MADAPPEDDPTPKRRGRPPAGGREAILAATLELLTERGVARLTTREIAERAGVSDASVYYHYTDKAGLLQAVFAAGLAPLRTLGEQGLGDGDDVLLRLARAIEKFLDLSLPVIMAAQSDTALRTRLAAYMTEEDLGPHRGVQTLSQYLRAEQAAGRVRADVDVEAAASLLVGAAYLRASQRQIMGKGSGRMPSLERTIATLDGLLRT